MRVEGDCEILPFVMPDGLGVAPFIEGGPTAGVDLNATGDEEGAIVLRSSEGIEVPFVPP